MTTGKYYTTLYKNLKNLSERFENDAINAVFIVTTPETQAYLYCGFGNNYVYKFNCDDSTDESLFIEFTDEQVNVLLQTAKTSKLTASEKEEANTKATTYLSEKCLALAKKAVNSFREYRIASLRGELL